MAADVRADVLANWSEADIATLKELVRVDGAGDWATKVTPRPYSYNPCGDSVLQL